MTAPGAASRISSAFRIAPLIPSAPGVKTNCAPNALSRLRRSRLMVSGMVRTSLYPLTDATQANPTPVFPLVGSIIVAPGFNKPFPSASSIMAKAALSFTLPPGLKYSNLATTSAPNGFPPHRVIASKGVFPINSVKFLFIFIFICF